MTTLCPSAWVAPSPSYPDNTEPIQRRPYADWFGDIGHKHIHPISENGRLLPHFFAIPTGTKFTDIVARSLRVMAQIEDMAIEFRDRWSSARFFCDEYENHLIFYFADKADAAVFKLLWASA